MESLAKNQFYTVTIEGYTSDGAGVCRIGGRAVFIKGTLAGEIWEIRIVKVSSSAVYGKAEVLIQASPHRAVPACPQFGKCGGCDLLHMTYDEELRMKYARVNDAIQRIGGLPFSVDGIVGSDHTESYRNKAIYAVAAGNNGQPVTGFFRARTHEVMPVERCLIQPELSDRVAACLRHWMAAQHVSAYDEQTGRGTVRHLFVRCARKTRDAMACIVAARGFGAKTSSLVDALRCACPELTSIVLCINKTRGNTVLAGTFHTLWGQDYVEDILCGLRFQLSPMAFFQINPPQAERLYQQALDYASPDGNSTVLDLYCGAGTITLCLARGAKRVIGAEIVPDAVENARANAIRNGIDNAEFLCGDAADAAAQLAARQLNPDTIVVDPPRKGLGSGVIDSIVEMSPQRVVYISCDPGTLARDLKQFAAANYLPQKGMAFDLFPRCAHVETAILLSRKMPNHIE